MTTHRTKKLLYVKERKAKFAARQTTRAEILHVEEEGYITSDKVDEVEQRTVDLTQTDIKSSVDIFSAQKRFDLELPLYGPYKIDYTRNGRHLLLGGRKGHVAAFDWQTKKLHCEMNVMEQVNDVKWLHIETMYAVAQRQWTYIYDNQGVEVHCLKVLDRSLHLEFLPYHFLLAATNEAGYLSYIDVSIGKKVASYNTRVANGNGKCGTSIMCQNPSNALIGLGHAGGVLTFWSPNQREPLVKMLAHKSTLRSIAIDRTGTYMATSGVDAKLKIWDLRTYKCLHEYRTASNGASSLSFSQKNLLAASYRDVVEIYNDICDNESASNELPRYLLHQCSNGASASSLAFCPYEDVLGVGHERGFVSLLVPGAGEPNFDALEANPYQTKKQRKHAEVKQLLDKIQPDMITLDNSVLSEIDRKGFIRKQEDKRNNFNFVKPKELIIQSDKKKGKIGKRLARKTQIRDTKLKEFLQQQQLKRKKNKN
ncbi:unnamed protein product [Rotaria magnacalcarata]|uniref:BING4 C-terminal domain-containing protein n=1 Tax=Rotaria magnacalcarata TaxID=392030 RepID=A0A816JWS6_9BILA|nr:unnamed protein product [Rotaria magnacalcarata]CAF1224992.1 unnamed protein product [Rotaria magnacalcarata]CAF1910631.1 unnamed protein product [Rotaria magnacalcarata]CAF3865338.1 unnamed protein product [Rotaria magnacalcarata]CAF3981736.1 unnamed protein product [Rotaria magnacalcarata]